MSSETDVIIIGAGSAGLAAAKQLQQLGMTFRVVEGAHRTGGRAYSEEIAPGAWFDLGCSYLHQATRNPFVEIAESLGVPVNRADADIFEHIEFHRNAQRLTGTDRDDYVAYYNGCLEAVAQSTARGEDKAIADLVDLESPYIIPFAAGMAALNTKDIDETSAADLASFKDDSDGGIGDMPIPGGYGNLIRRWGEDVPVDLNCKVEKIDWSGKQVSVETVKGTLRAKAVLVTVSTGILASNAILFDPMLPDWKIQSYLDLPTGTENKIALHFDKDVFGEEGRGFHVAWNDDGTSGGFDANINRNNMAVVFTGGRHAVWLERQGQQAGHDFAVDRVAEAFGNDIRKHVTNSIVTAWTTEPWTLGSYSCAKPGQAHQRGELAKPIDDCMFFAGEATHIGSQATCHGAYLSGLRAAQEIADALAGEIQ